MPQDSQVVFLQWWNSERLSPAVQNTWKSQCPPVVDTQSIFQTFQDQLRKFERKLNKVRISQAKTKRHEDRNLVFQDCKSEAPLPIDALYDRREGVVEEVLVDEQAIVLADAFAYRPNLPVILQGIPLAVIAHDSDKMWVADVGPAKPGDVIVQEERFTSEEEIINQLEKLWKPRWQKVSHVETSQWSQITDFCAQVMQPIEWVLPTMSSDVLRLSAQRKKKRSATGSDGVSRADLLALPREGLQVFTDMLSGIEAGGEWPAQLRVGFVNSLAKAAGTLTMAEGYRPVTVYPLLYRCWSSIRSRQALKSLQQVLPRSVQGGTPGGQTKTVWYHLAKCIEECHVHHTSMQGLLVGIKKAFNAIPRYPIWFMLTQLGFPEGVLQAWAQFVSTQERSFRVRAAVSNPLGSNVGFPEGCGLSVMAMVLVDWLLDLWLHACEPTLELASFVDDWNVSLRQVEHFDIAWNALSRFTRIMDMEIDEDKTHAWAAQASDRKVLRLGPVEVVLHAKSLGAHHNFCRRAGNVELKKRLTKMPEFWQRLKRSYSPYAYKITALLMSAWPQALYGVSIVHLGAAHFSTLRAGAMKALKSNRKGANAMVHLATHTPKCDPELWAILQTVRDAREFSEDGSVHAMLLRFLQHGGPGNGPTSILLARLRRLGWELQPDGTFRDGISNVDVLRCSWEELVFRARVAWANVLGQEVLHRATFEGIHRADLRGVQQMLDTFSPADQVLLRCHLNGTLYITTGRAKFAGVSDRCPWCNERDGFRHRAWECEATACYRKHFSDQQNEGLVDLPPCMLEHCWLVRPPEYDTLLETLAMIPESDPFHLSPTDDQPVHLFVDGSCTGGEDIQLRLASWACTAAKAGSFHHQLLGAGCVPGVLQSAYRGELWAMLMACRAVQEYGVQVTIWCDNIAVVAGVRKILAGIPVRVNRPHSDLWLRIADAVNILPAGILTVCKVVSHADLKSAKDEVEVWAFWHNGLVDRYAAEANQRRPANFMSIWEAARRALSRMRELFKLVVDVHLQTARKAVQEQNQTSHQDASVVVGGQTASGSREAEDEANDHAVPAGAHDTSRPADVEVSVADVPRIWTWSNGLGRVVGDESLRILCDWWSQVVARETTQDKFWVSGVHLFLDFQATMGVNGPILHDRKWYTSVDELPGGAEVTMVRRVRVFTGLLRSFLDDNGVCLTSAHVRPHGAAIGMRIASYHLNFPRNRFEAVDNHILSQHGRQLMKLGDVNRCTVPSYSVAWRLAR